jgi:hypothetical protein
MAVSFVPNQSALELSFLVGRVQCCLKNRQPHRSAESARTLALSLHNGIAGTRTSLLPEVVFAVNACSRFVHGPGSGAGADGRGGAAGSGGG